MPLLAGIADGWAFNRRACRGRVHIYRKHVAAVAAAKEEARPRKLMATMKGKADSAFERKSRQRLRWRTIDQRNEASHIDMGYTTYVHRSKIGEKGDRCTCKSGSVGKRWRLEYRTTQDMGHTSS